MKREPFSYSAPQINEWFLFCALTCWPNVNMRRLTISREKLCLHTDRRTNRWKRSVCKNKNIMKIHNVGFTEWKTLNSSHAIEDWIWWTLPMCTSSVGANCKFFILFFHSIFYLHFVCSFMYPFHTCELFMLRLRWMNQNQNEKESHR